MRQNLVKLTVILSTASLLFFGDLWAAEKSESKKLKGKISNISQKAKTIALSTKEGGLVFLKFTEKTKLKELASYKELKSGEAILVEYQSRDGENIALSLQKALVKLPAGTSKISTEQLAAMLQDKAKKVVLIDARPAAKYGQGHIKGALSIPYAMLKKEGEKGAQRLEAYKDRQLIFYCGGST